MVVLGPVGPNRPDWMAASNSKLLMIALVSFSYSKTWSATLASATSRAPVPLRLVRTTGVGSQLLHDMSLEAEAANGRAAIKPQAMISLLVTENTRPIGNLNAISTTTKFESTAKWWKVNEIWYQNSFGSARGKFQQYYSTGTARGGENSEKKPRNEDYQGRTSPLVTLVSDPVEVRSRACQTPAFRGGSSARDRSGPLARNIRSSKLAPDSPGLPCVAPPERGRLPLHTSKSCRSGQSR